MYPTINPTMYARVRAALGVGSMHMCYPRRVVRGLPTYLPTYLPAYLPAYLPSPTA